jgi:hypothetical protein
MASQSLEQFLILMLVTGSSAECLKHISLRSIEASSSHDKVGQVIAYELVNESVCIKMIENAK